MNLFFFALVVTLPHLHLQTHNLKVHQILLNVYWGVLIFSSDIKFHESLCPFDLLIKVGFWNGEEAAVSLGSHSEYERFSSQDSKLTNELSRMCHKKTSLFFAVNHPLVNMKKAWNHKLDAHLLKHRESTTERTAQIWPSDNKWSYIHQTTCNEILHLSSLCLDT